MDKDQIKEHFKKQLELLQLERKEDLEQYKKLMSDTSIEERRKRGICWHPVQLNKTSFDAGDRIIIEVTRNENHTESHVFQSGKSISLFSTAGKNEEHTENVKAVVNYVKKNTMTITLNADDSPDWINDGQLGVQLLFDESTYKEMERAITLCMNSEDATLQKHKNILFGDLKAKFNSIYEYNIPYLNESQNKALMNVLSAEDVAIIHGPPGTGKTTTIIQCIIQNLKNTDQVLVCAPSNAAVDLLTEKLVEKKVDVVRLGHPARITDTILQQTIDVKTTKHIRYKELKAVKQQENQYRNAAQKYKRNFGREEREERKMLWSEANKLRKEVRSLSEYIANDIIDKAQVITCTLVGSSTQVLRGKRFSTVYIDEAGQGLEAATWIPIQRADRIILAGDHQQLPPTIKSIKAAKEGLEKTLFEQLITSKKVDVMLQEQYRMNEKIMNFSSEFFYNNSLIANENVKDHLIFDGDLPLEFIDTAGTGFNDYTDPESLSTSNKEEADILQKHMTAYFEEIQQQQKFEEVQNVGVITPYKAQVKALKSTLYHLDFSDEVKSKININTVDSFQGQERDIIYISLVRSNDDGVIGFLQNTKRMNVAMTRARKKLVVIGDSSTICRHHFYKKFVDYTQEIGAYRSAFELMY
ncbi:AAA domain-containing protein [Flammeovirga sp. SJP92]|uniref:AAA domain-containing protein n=1 Tax=Flammeovirga sp. SJP92 TaxID=1775430 RepID=UPI000787F4E2|nr:AAA domain-containing protein [Flammeovirga sp. SJP92]KXX67267.1 DNA-binding protein [Flammeovirga sp. SJP92]